MVTGEAMQKQSSGELLPAKRSLFDSHLMGNRNAERAFRNFTLLRGIENTLIQRRIQSNTSRYADERLAELAEQTDTRLMELAEETSLQWRQFWNKDRTFDRRGSYQFFDNSSEWSDNRKDYTTINFEWSDTRKDYGPKPEENMDYTTIISSQITRVASQTIRSFPNSYRMFPDVESVKLLISLRALETPYPTKCDQAIINTQFWWLRQRNETDERNLTYRSDSGEVHRWPWPNLTAEIVRLLHPYILGELIPALDGENLGALIDEIVETSTPSLSRNIVEGCKFIRDRPSLLERILDTFNDAQVDLLAHQIAVHGKPKYEELVKELQNASTVVQGWIERLGKHLRDNYKNGENFVSSSLNQ